MTTESRATNPFLVEHLDNSCHMTNASRTVFNPFEVASETMAMTTPSSNSSNPFLQSTTNASEGNLFASSSAVTNPFAAFFQTEQTTQSANIASDTNLINVGVTSHPFDEQKHTETNSTFRKDEHVPDLLLDNNVAHGGISVSSDVPDQTGPPVMYRRDSQNTTTSPPRRPPPPRPTLPKKTKDLILSVTGALEATSTDLLDRLQANRTPSPTPLKELNLPSPVAPLEVNDLLGDDDASVSHTRNAGTGATQVANDIHEEATNIFNVIDNLPKETETVQPSSLLMSSPPLFSQSAQLSSISMAQPPQPPSRPPPPQLPIQIGEVNLADLLIEEDVTKPTTGLSNWSSPMATVAATAAAAPQSEFAEFDIPATTRSTNSRSSSISMQSASSPASGLAVDTGANYTATRKASYDITAGRIRIPQSRKKYSLDYSATGAVPITGQQAGIFDTASDHSAELALGGYVGQGTDYQPSRINEIADRIDESNRYDVKDDLKTAQYFDSRPSNITGTSALPTSIDNKVEAEIQYAVGADGFGEVLSDFKPEMSYHMDPNLTHSVEKLDLNVHEQISDYNFETAVAKESQPSPFDNLFDQPNDIVKAKDDFDVFERKFESFKDDSNRINEGTGSTAVDPFDPFGGAPIMDEDGDRLKGTNITFRHKYHLCNSR